MGEASNGWQPNEELLAQLKLWAKGGVKKDGDGDVQMGGDEQQQQQSAKDEDEDMKTLAERVEEVELDDDDMPLNLDDL